MTKEEYIKSRLSMTVQQLVDELVATKELAAKRESNILQLRKILQVKEETIVEMKKQLENTEKIGEYYNTKHREPRRKDINNEVLKRLYVDEKKSVYKIAKETGWTDMTIRHRLKALGVYEGKDRYSKEGK